MSNAFTDALAAATTTDPIRRVPFVSMRAVQAISPAHGLSTSAGIRAALRHGTTAHSLLKNLHALSVSDQTTLMDATVLLVGAGGLGGYALELLARLGAGRIRLADGDVFEESNLNRQLLSSVDTLGMNKALAGAERISRIAPHVIVEALPFFVDASNAAQALDGTQVVIDALGGIAPRQQLHQAASHAGLPVISAGIAGWTALVGSETPGQCGISSMWADQSATDAEHALGSLAPTASLAAALMVAEATQYLTTGTLRLAGRMLSVDLLTFDFQIYDFT